MTMADFEKLAEAMGDLLEDDVYEIVEEIMADGGSQAQEALEACQKGMDIIGERFETGEYFVGDLIFSGELMLVIFHLLELFGEHLFSFGFLQLRAPMLLRS